MACGSSRVFVNPNFKKRLVHQNASITNPVQPHINPAFPRQLPQTVPSYKPKIFINPNFIIAKEHPQNLSASDTVTCHINRNFVPPVTYSQSRVPLTTQSDWPTYSEPETLSVQSVSTNNIATEVTAPPISKSRYNIVRAVHKPTSSISVSDSNSCANPQTNTIKLSRYKSVNVNSLKKSIFPSTSKSAVPPVRSQQASSKYKFVKANASAGRTDLKHHSKYKLSRRSIDTAKIRNVSRKPLAKYTVVAKRKSYRQPPSGHLKVNNIPCPLYRKYGKCLRRERHACPFLHDRKHVAICRKFLRGLCFDGSCLLSHELTSKKMPTCHFYLQGMCAKENCPYLHVKLSENAKICPDFLKGYCEKGDACLKRHVHPKKVKAAAKKNITSNNTSVNKVRPPSNRVTKPSAKESVERTAEVSKDGRYYKENVDSSEECVIKPTRVKLGTLPSFIKFS